MLFNSYAFLLVFLPAAIAIYRVADDYPHLRVGVLVVLSLIFYGYWDVRFVPLMVGSILLNWWASRLFVATKNSAVIVVAVVAHDPNYFPDPKSNHVAFPYFKIAETEIARVLTAMLH